MMLKLEEEGHIKEVKIARSAPSISHLIFADDSLFFYKANNDSCRKIRQTVDLFCRISGEAINFDKSSVIFSPNIPNCVKLELKDIFKTPCSENLGRYLGCNVEVDGRSTQAYHSLVDKIHRKITTWKHLTLSPASMAILINDILAALCADVLSVFLVPKSVVQKMGSLAMQFWWKGSSDKRGVCWVKRSKLETPKGMGVWV